jgi:outer membrane protein assembly factor BamB
MKHDKLYIFSNGRVAAINKKDGIITWEIKIKDIFKKASYSGFGTILEESGKLYIGISGHLICLSAKDGALLWANELKGWGYQYVSIAGANNESQVAAMMAAQAAAAAAAS